MASGIEPPFGLLSTTAGSNAEGQHKHVDRRKHEEPHKRGALRRHHRQRIRISRRDRKPNVGPMGTAPDLHNQLFALASSSEALALPWDWHERSIESRLPASRRSQQRSQSNLYASGFLHHHSVRGGTNKAKATVIRQPPCSLQQSIRAADLDNGGAIAQSCFV